MPKLFFGKAILARPVCSKENGSEPWAINSQPNEKALRHNFPEAVTL